MYYHRILQHALTEEFQWNANFTQFILITCDSIIAKALLVERSINYETLSVGLSSSDRYIPRTRWTDKIHYHMRVLLQRIKHVLPKHQ